MPIVQIIIDDSTSKVITGTYEFDRTNGGTLLVPSGSAFPGTPAAKELFWRTDEAKLYRRSDANDAWVAVVSAVAAHATTHQPGGSDAMAVDAVAATGSLRTIGTGALQACAGNDARLSDARTPTAHASTHKGDGADAIAVATTSVAGLESAADKTKLDGIATGATNTPLSSTAPVNVTKAAASAGVATEASRQDHKHDVTTAAPGATGVATASGEGSATSLARSDHTHQSNTAPANVTKAAAAIGTSGEPARADHKHDVSTAAPGTVTFGSAAEGSATSLARSDHTHALTTPSAPADVTKSAAATGSSANVARQDHKHDVTTAAAGAATPGDSVAEGSATSLARSDHRHSLPAFGTGVGTFCQGNDARLSDARTPTAHASSHQPGGGDAMAVDAVAGTGSLRTLGTTATSACAGNDSRLSDARTPTAHATSHQSGGSDAVKLDDLAAPDDNTDLNASASAHGLLRKLSNVSTEFLNGQGNWATPAGSSPVFGTEAQFESSEGDSTTTGTTYVSKLLLTTPSIPAGNYHVTWSIEAAANASNRDIGIAVYGDGALAAEHSERLVVANYFVSVSGVGNGVMGAGVHTVELFFRRAGGSSATITVRRARIEFWRIS